MPVGPSPYPNPVPRFIRKYTVPDVGDILGSGGIVYRPVSVGRRLQARAIDWVLYVVVGLGLVLALVLGLRFLEARFVEIGDEELVEDVAHFTVPPVERDVVIAVEAVIEKYETALRDAFGLLFDSYKRVAEDLGISVEEAIEKLAWQPPFWDLVAEIREELPDDYSGAAIRDDYTAWIGFAGEAPAAAVEAIRAFSRSVTPIDIIEHRGFSEQEVYEEVRNRRSQIHRRQRSFGIGGHPESLEGVEQAIAALLLLWLDLPPPLFVVSALQLGLTGLILLFIVEIPLTAVAGQTIGKTLANIKVVRMDDGRHPGWRRSMARWVVLYVPFAVPLIGPLLFILMVVSPLFDSGRRGWYDRAAGTVVISNTDFGRVADHD